MFFAGRHVARSSESVLVQAESRVLSFRLLGQNRAVNHVLLSMLILPLASVLVGLHRRVPNIEKDPMQLLRVEAT